MSAKRNWFYKLSIAAVVFGMVAISSVLITGEPASKRVLLHHVGMVDDWSFHHLVYSNPGTYDQVKNDPAALSRLLNIQYNTRYIMQQMKRAGSAVSASTLSASTAPATNLISENGVSVRVDALAARPAPKQTLKKDWNALQLTGAVLPNAYPAKYTFSTNGTPDCTHDYVVYPVGSAGAAPVAASITGTFSDPSGTGTLAVNSITLTASPGTAASQSTTINANGVASGNTITISSTLTTTLTLTAGTPVKQEDQIAVAATGTSGAEVKVQGIEYEFEALVGGVLPTPPSGFCYINSALSQATRVADLASAIGFTGSGGSTTTWECNANAIQPSNGVVVTSSTSPDVDVTAKIQGSTGFGTPTTGGTNPPAVSVLTAGSDGSSTASNFQWWSGAAAVSPAQLATNISNAMVGNTHQITGSNPSSGVVTIAATLSGSAGNSITVATTIGSGLASPAFSGSLSGGGSGTTSGATFSTSTDLNSTLALNEAANASNLVAAITASVPGFTAGNASNVVTVTDNTAGAAGNTVPTTGTLTLNSNTIFSWAHATLENGANAGANIIAYNNLYATTCSTGTVPSVYWAYNTGTGYSVTTSPVLSLDGTKGAFIQTNGSGAQLVVLYGAASTTETVSSAAIPTTSTDITSCTAPCMTVTTITGATGDTYSSPFYDYNTDALYVGDNASHLYKMTGVFNGTTSPGVTQITLNSTAYSVASPIYDSTSGCVFVGDTEGFLYSVSSGVAGTVCTGNTFALFGQSENLRAGGANEGIFDAPLVDPSAEMVYAFVTDSAAIGNCASGVNCIAQFAASTITTGSTTAAPFNEEPLGTGGASYPIYSGAFDNVYLSSSTPSSPSGSLYVVGGTATTTGAELYRVPISSNALATPVAVTSISSGGAAGLNGTRAPWASPITEFCNNGASACTASGGVTNNGNDRIFFSSYESHVNTTCYVLSVSCVLEVNINNPASITLGGFINYSNFSGNGCYATGGFIIDNASTSTGASQVYYTWLGGNTPAGRPANCVAAVTGNTIQAIQAAQAGL